MTADEVGQLSHRLDVIEERFEDRMNTQDDTLEHQTRVLDHHSTVQSEIKADIREVRGDVKDLNTDVRSLIDMVNLAGGPKKFVETHQALSARKMMLTTREKFIGKMLIAVSAFGSVATVLITKFNW